MKELVLPYNQARTLIQEADVLLFRAGKFPSAGWLITSYTGGIHSHVGLAHWDNHRVYCVEQREFKGGRSVLLSRQAQCNHIDVFRASPVIWTPIVNDTVQWVEKKFTSDVANNITDMALSLTGTDYGWRTIFEIGKGYMPFYRLVYKSKNGDETISRAYVCSTLVTYTYRTYYEDPCPNLNDTRTTPGDLAQSALFSYIFSLGE